MPGFITNGPPSFGTEAEIYNPASGEWKIRAKAPNKGAYQVKYQNSQKRSGKLTKATFFEFLPI